MSCESSTRGLDRWAAVGYSGVVGNTNLKVKVSPAMLATLTDLARRNERSISGEIRFALDIYIRDQNGARKGDTK